MAYVSRIAKGEPLTYEEMDGNFLEMDAQFVAAEGYALDAQGSAIEAQNAADSAQSIIDDAVADIEFAVEDNANRIRNLEYGDGPYPSLDLLFTGAKSVDPRLVVERATPKWVFNERGLLVEVPPNMPAIDYDPVTGKSLGLLVEGQATNLLKWSEDFTQGSWSTGASAVTETSMPSPVTGINWKEVTTTTTGNYHGRLTQIVGLTPGKLTIYAFVKAANHQFIRIRLGKNGELDPDIIFDLGDGSFHVRQNSFSVELTPSSKRVGDAWYVTVTIDASHITPGACSVHIGSADNKSAVSSSAGNSFLLAVAQLEVGSFPTSYIKTEASQVTRAASLPVVDTDVFRYNENEWTLVFECNAPVGNLSLIKIGNDIDSQLGLSVRRTDSSVLVETRISEDAPSEIIFPSASPGCVRCAISFKAGVIVKASVNGSAVQSVATAWDGEASQLFIGRGGISGSNIANRALNGHFTRLAYYPRALSDAQLQALTA